MKYAAIVLRNTNSPISTVRYGEVVDAFLSGGVPLDEVAVLSYADRNAITVTLTRLASECDGVFFICDRVLMPFAKDAVSGLAGRNFSGECLLETENTLFGVLPASSNGCALVKEECIPAVDKRRGVTYYKLVLRTVAAPAERVFSAIASAREASRDRVTIHTSEEFGAGRIELLYDQDTPKTSVDEAVRILSTELNDYVYSHEDESVAHRLYTVLKLHRMKLATAESFTGGGVGHAVVEIPGASKVFYEGINAYSNQSKMARLGVTDYTLKKFGAVSNETAYEMAAGLLKEGKCDLAVATTGIAGPDADGTDKPVGLCYIAVGTMDRVRVFRFLLDGDREAVTKRATNLALFLAYKEVNG